MDELNDQPTIRLKDIDLRPAKVFGVDIATPLKFDPETMDSMTEAINLLCKHSGVKGRFYAVQMGRVCRVKYKEYDE